MPVTARCVSGISISVATIWGAASRPPSAAPAGERRGRRAPLASRHLEPDPQRARRERQRHRQRVAAEEHHAVHDADPERRAAR
jgi:hypothetical protein